jgi:hypothetical protein
MINSSMVKGSGNTLQFSAPSLLIQKLHTLLQLKAIQVIRLIIETAIREKATDGKKKTEVILIRTLFMWIFNFLILEGIKNS